MTKSIQLFLARSDDSAFDSHRLFRFLTLRRRLIDRVRNFDPFSHSPKRRKLPVKMMPGSDENEKVSRGAVWFVGARHGNDAAHVFDETRLIGKLASHPLRQLLAPLLARGKIAALNHKVLHRATKRCRIKRARRRQVEKISHSFWCSFRHKCDLDGAELSLERDALARHLLNWRTIERFRGGRL